MFTDVVDLIIQNPTSIDGMTPPGSVGSSPQHSPLSGDSPMGSPGSPVFQEIVTGMIMIIYMYLQS